MSNIKCKFFYHFLPVLLAWFLEVFYSYLSLHSYKIYCSLATAKYTSSPLNIIHSLLMHQHNPMVFLPTSLLLFPSLQFPSTWILFFITDLGILSNLLVFPQLSSQSHRIKPQYIRKILNCKPEVVSCAYRDFIHNIVCPCHHLLTHNLVQMMSPTLSPKLKTLLLV